MDLAGLREALRRVPFEQFTIQLADGRALPVSHPEFVAVGQRRVIVVAEDDSWSVVEPLLIVSLEYSSTSDDRGNGTKRKKRRRKS